VLVKVLAAKQVLSPAYTFVADAIKKGLPAAYTREYGVAPL
jgi:hypothetical protein